MKKLYLLIITLTSLVYIANAQKPVANFSASDSSVCDNDCIQFTDLSTNNPTSWKWYFPGAVPATSTDQNPMECYIYSGSFDVSLVASNSFGSDSVTVTNLVTTFDPPPTPMLYETFTVPDTFYCYPDSSYVFYQWYYNSILVSAGANDTMFITNQYGNVNLAVVNANCCFLSVGIMIVEAARVQQASMQLTGDGPCGLSSVGIHNYSPCNSFTVSPNPANDKIVIHASAYYNPATVTILNVLGQEASPPAPLLEERGEVSVDVSKFPPGIYFLQLKTAGGLAVSRFIKQ